MFDINHQVGIAASPETVYNALTTDEGLASWWTNKTSGSGSVGSIITFRFPENGPDFKVVELVPNERVKWEHHGSMPEAWMGTFVLFELRPDGDQTFVRFTHGNWKEASNFHAHCSTKWGVFMVSLKDFLETGTGRPFPSDIHIDHS